MLAALHDDVESLAVLGIAILAPREQLRESDHAVERRAQLVTHVGEERAFRAGRRERALLGIVEQIDFLRELGGAFMHDLFEHRRVSAQRAQSQTHGEVNQRGEQRDHRHSRERRLIPERRNRDVDRDRFRPRFRSFDARLHFDAPVSRADIFDVEMILGRRRSPRVAQPRNAHPILQRLRAEPRRRPAQMQRAIVGVARRHRRPFQLQRRRRNRLHARIESRHAAHRADVHDAVILDEKSAEIALFLQQPFARIPHFPAAVAIAADARRTARPNRAVGAAPERVNGLAGKAIRFAHPLPVARVQHRNASRSADPDIAIRKLEHRVHRFRNGGHALRRQMRDLIGAKDRDAAQRRDPELAVLQPLHVAHVHVFELRVHRVDRMPRAALAHENALRRTAGEPASVRRVKESHHETGGKFQHLTKLLSGLPLEDAEARAGDEHPRLRFDDRARVFRQSVGRGVLPRGVFVEADDPVLKDAGDEAVRLRAPIHAEAGEQRAR